MVYEWNSQFVKASWCRIWRISYFEGQE